MVLEKLDGHLWNKLVVASSAYLETRKDIVDALNVFPVPDGDTGTNMSLTMISAAAAAKQKEAEKQIGTAAKTISYGALMGARGNSGVILSQLLAGFAKRCENCAELDPRSFSEAWACGVDTAYNAVTNPVEGTILTVSKEAAHKAVEAGGQRGATINSVLAAAYQGASLALAKTPSMLDILRQAGVVDAGGQGFVFILEGMIKSLKGEDLTAVPLMDSKVTEKPKIEYTQDTALKYQYCTEFILKKVQEDLKLEEIRAFLTEKGDCMLVVGAPEMSKIHIHTNHPGMVLEYCSGLGSLHEIQIHNMSEQSKEMKEKARAVKRLGIISVAMGPGLINIFKSLGVDVVIPGGQTMNPSTQDFIEAIDKILAEEVLILPNNGNVVMAAQQAADAASKPTQVVLTKSIPQGIAALMAFNAENDTQSNKHKMEDAAKQVITVEVTYAVRDALYNGYNIQKGQVLGIVDDMLVTTGEQVDQVVADLFSQYLIPSHELITIYCGEGVTEGEAQKFVESLSQTYAGIDFEMHYGGQPLYYYLMSIE